MKKYFFGKYYKFICEDGFSFALIISTSNEGPELQLITKEYSYVIDNKDSVKVNNNVIDININQNDITLLGKLTLGELHPLKKPVMGWFRFLPLECKHNVYSMFHTVNGSLICNGTTHNFNNGYGYIEGDGGVNFPKKYIWYNSVKLNQSVTLAIATIPIGFIKFIGVLCFIKTIDKEYYLCTYNSVKCKKINKDEIIIKKGKYKLTLQVLGDGGHLLKAPSKGLMSRYIKENLNIKTRYIFTKGKEVLLDSTDEFSSLEFMFD